MLKSSLSAYSDAYIFVKGVITISANADTTQAGERNRGIIFKNLCHIHWLHKWNK